MSGKVGVLRKICIYLKVIVLYGVDYTRKRSLQTFWNPESCMGAVQHTLHSNNFEISLWLLSNPNSTMTQWRFTTLRTVMNSQPLSLFQKMLKTSSAVWKLRTKLILQSLLNPGATALLVTPPLTVMVLSSPLKTWIKFMCRRARSLFRLELAGETCILRLMILIM